MLHLHFSNRFEALSAQVLQRLGQSPAGVFDAVTVVVPSAAVRRALQLAVADHLGVSTQLHCPYLAPWLWQQMARVLPGVPAQSPWAPPVLRWRVQAVLADTAWVCGHPRLHSYLAAADDVMRLELSTRIAQVFDQIITYRPDWLLAWQAGTAVELGARSPHERDDAAWQAALWRRLAAGSQPAGHVSGAHFVAALQRLNPAEAAALGLPPVLHVLALPTMPPLHVHWLQHIGRLMDVHLYVLNPCQEYWFELLAPRRLSHLAARGDARALAHQEVGHRLLATWGRQTQALVDNLVDSAGEQATDDASFVVPPGHTLLARLQRSILELQEPLPGDWALDACDRSLEVHVCHSLTRELEVLHDHLLGLLARGELQHPSQVLVVTPDLEAAAPLIDAVFGTVPRERALPYTLTGRARSRVNAVARALLTVLGLAGSRFQASAVFALLQQDIVARRFGLDAAALQQVHALLLAAGVRWGLDASHRASLGLPASDAQTWQDAIDRLFLGYALPSDHTLVFGQHLPAGDAEGQDAWVLGALAQFIDRLRALHQAAATPRTPNGWRQWLVQTVDQFLLPQGDELEDQRELLAAVHELADQQQQGGLGDTGAALLSFALMRAALAQQLDDPARGGVPSGGITFSAMSSLRGLPFDHVCVIGLNDGAFPGSQRMPEFDLMPLQPRRGDRQRGHDERNLFLDLLLAARRSLYLSHTGRSVRDNTPLPPSVLVSELLDMVLPAVAQPRDDPDALTRARQRLVVQHPLQPFDDHAFRPDADPRLRSFNAELAQALRHSQQARAAPLPQAIAVDEDKADENIDEGDVEGQADVDVLARAARALPVFFSQPLAAPEPAWRQLSPGQLHEFFRNPCRSLLRRRLGLDLGWAEEALQDEEAFLPDTRARTALAQRLLPLLLAGASAVDLQALAQAGHELPPGALGQQLLGQELDALTRFATELSVLQATPAWPPQPLQLQWTSDTLTWHLQGAFTDLRPSGQLRWRYAPLRAADRLSAWIAHLLLCAQPPAGVQPHTVCLASDQRLQFTPLPPARAHALLGELVALRHSGLQTPLHFFPRASWAFVDAGGSLEAAQKAWQVSARTPHGESADPAYRLALRGCDNPLDARFEQLAWQVCGPLHEMLAATNEAGTHTAAAP